MDLGRHKQFLIESSNVAPLFSVGCNGPWNTNELTDVLKLALTSAGSGVWECDLITETVRLSPQSCEHFGLPEGHSGLMPLEEWLSLLDIRDAGQIQQWACSPEASSTPLMQEFRIRRPDGERRWLRISACMTPDQEGRHTKLVGLQIDVTDRKRTEGQLRESDERFRLIQEAALVGTFEIDCKGRIVGSQQCYRNLGLPEDTESMDLDTLMNLVHPEDRDRVRREVSVAVSPTFSIDTEYRINRADTGELRWIFARVRCERDENGKLVRLVGAHLDISGPKLAEAALQESNALNQSILEASADCVKLVDLDGRLLFMNQRGLEALEIEDGTALIGAEWATVLPPAERHKVQAAIDAARQGQTGHFNAGCPTTTGKPKWWDVVVTPVCDEHGQPKHLLAISRDITDHRDRMAQIRWTASHDMLTELPNRRYFGERLEKVLSRASAQGLSVGLLLLDIDDFKRTNDAHGHDAGDALLKRFAQCLRKAVRRHDMIARLGGDEFAIIISDLADEWTLSAVVRDIQSHLSEPFIYSGQVFDCRASIGKAIYPRHGQTADDLLKSADIALYVAKASGRGEVRRFDASMRSEMERRMAMVEQARAALRYDFILPFYQPKIDLVTGHPAGFEALLRWQDAEGKIQPPAAIAAAFEDIDVAQALSERIQQRVLADMRRWKDEGIDFGHIAINASAAEFRQNDFAERLLDRIRSAGVPTNCVELEVTETVFVGRGADYVGRALKLLSAEGVRIALDDFGTGYASLSHLRQFPVDVLKIDQSFVRDLEINPDDSVIIEALISLGKKLSIGIVAEGIENPAQAAFLAEQGCDYGQGYLFSKAVAAAEVPQLIAKLKSGPAGLVRVNAQQFKVQAVGRSSAIV